MNDINPAEEGPGPEGKIKKLIYIFLIVGVLLYVFWETIYVEVVFHEVCKEKSGDKIDRVVNSDGFESSIFAIPFGSVLDGSYEYVETTYDPSKYRDKIFESLKYFRLSMVPSGDPSCDFNLKVLGPPAGGSWSREGKCLGLEEIPELSARYRFELDINRRLTAGKWSPRPYFFDQSRVIDRVSGEILALHGVVHMRMDKLREAFVSSDALTKRCPQSLELYSLYLRALIPSN